MATLKLTVTSPPVAFTEPLMVSEVEHFLGLVSLSPEDSERTMLLEGLIIAARELAETFQNRDLISKQWDKRLDLFPCGAIPLRSPLVSVDAVSYTNSAGTDTPLTEGTDYIWDSGKEPGLLLPAYGKSWPSFTPYPSSAVLVRFTSGYDTDDPFWSDSGQRVLVGMKMLISDWFQNRLPRGAGPDDIPAAIRYLLSAGSVPRSH